MSSSSQSAAPVVAPNSSIFLGSNPSQAESYVYSVEQTVWRWVWLFLSLCLLVVVIAIGVWLLRKSFQSFESKKKVHKITYEQPSLSPGLAPLFGAPFGSQGSMAGLRAEDFV
jgi:hypothetical protein